jgi:adenylate cyclase
LILADFLLLAFATLTDNPMSSSDWPPGQKLNQAREIYFFVLLAGGSACYEPRRVLWAGFCAILSWSLGFLWLTSQPNAITILDTGEAPSLESWMVLVSSPNFLDFNRLIEAVVAIAIVTCILATVALNARRMVRGEIASTRERAILARYFAPAIVEDLANHDAPFAVVNAQPAAVLFAHVVGFTAMAQDEPPERVIGFLRALHQRLEQAIFENGSTLDKYMGDGVMAIFGSPRTAPDDACRAIAAARSIQQAADNWNIARADAEFPPVRLSVGVHYG